jgi:hypothetical protein
LIVSNKDSGFDGEVEMKIPKKEAQVYWSEIIRNFNPSTDYVWKSVQDFYLDELQDLQPKAKKTAHEKATDNESDVKEDVKVDAVTRAEDRDVVIDI